MPQATGCNGMQYEQGLGQGDCRGAAQLRMKRAHAQLQGMPAGCVPGAVVTRNLGWTEMPTFTSRFASHTGHKPAAPVCALCSPVTQCMERQSAPGQRQRCKCKHHHQRPPPARRSAPLDLSLLCRMQRSQLHVRRTICWRHQAGTIIRLQCMLLGCGTDSHCALSGQHERGQKTRIIRCTLSSDAS